MTDPLHELLAWLRDSFPTGAAQRERWADALAEVLEPRSLKTARKIAVEMHNMAMKDELSAEPPPVLPEVLRHICEWLHENSKHACHSSPCSDIRCFHAASEHIMMLAVERARLAAEVEHLREDRARDLALHNKALAEQLTLAARIDEARAEAAAAKADSERLDWLDQSRHVVCFDDGEWFCAWRGDGTQWEDRPMADTLREAIDAARTASRTEKEK